MTWQNYIPTLKHSDAYKMVVKYKKKKKQYYRQRDHKAEAHKEHKRR